MKSQTHRRRPCVKWRQRLKRSGGKPKMLRTPATTRSWRRQGLSLIGSRGQGPANTWIFCFLRFYLFMRPRERGGHRPRDRQAPCGEPDRGLNPGTPGSRPGPKADAPPLSPQGSPWLRVLNGGSFCPRVATTFPTYVQDEAFAQSFLGPLLGRCAVPEGSLRAPAQAVQARPGTGRRFWP